MRAFFSLLLPALLALQAHAEPGTTGAVFLKRPLGARSAAMGGAFCALAGTLDSIHYNPAGLAALPKKAVTSTYLNSIGGTSYGFLGYGQPTALGTFALGALYFNAGKIDLNLSDGTRGRVTAEEDYAFTLSYARELFSGLEAGATYRHIRMSLAETAHAVSHQSDVGLRWKAPVKGLSFAAAYQYYGPDIRFEEVGDPPPKTLRYGAAWTFADIPIFEIDPDADMRRFDVTLAADAAETLRERRSPRVGMEVGLEPAFLDRAAFRLGWVFEKDVETLSLGIGIREGSFLLDYAFGNAKGFNGLQQLSLTFLFK
ncbi:MAG: PorV/PorQ family protein [Elusimicrobiota bacterium]